MAKFSKKVMGKEVGDAATYAAPHKMNGKPLVMSTNPGKPVTKFAKGGKTNEMMLQYGRGMAKVTNQGK